MVRFPTILIDRCCAKFSVKQCAANRERGRIPRKCPNGIPRDKDRTAITPAGHPTYTAKNARALLPRQPERGRFSNG